MGQTDRTSILVHGCTQCYEINKGYIHTTSGAKVCKECGGVVLNLQEAFDYIADLKGELELYKNDF